MHKCLYIKPQCGAHTHDIFSVELLENGSLARVIQSTASSQNVEARTTTKHTHRNKILISFSFCRFFLIIVRRPMAKY